MKLFGCTVVKNEEGMIPYVMPYVERLGYDKFVVYDDHSTDKTIEKLSKYPFIEIREFPQQGTLHDFDAKKAEIQANFFGECWQYIEAHNNEEVWMSFTDFDEVLYNSGRNGLIGEITPAFYADNMVYLNSPMVEIINMDDSVLSESNTKLCHTMSNMRAHYHSTIFSKKPVLILVNAFSRIECFPGNHHMNMTVHDSFKNTDIKSLNNHGDLSIFHLKFANPIALKKKIETTLNNNSIIYDLDKAIENARASSFPIDLYFALDGLKLEKDYKSVKINY